MSATKFLEEFRPGQRVYIQGAVGEPAEAALWLSRDPARADGVTFVGCLLPGMNGFDYAALHENARVETFMISPALRTSFEAGKVATLPLPYSGIAARMARDAFDLAIVQVTPPDAKGECSFGMAADFGPLAWPRAKRVLAFVNASMPRPPRGPTMPFSAIHVAIETDAPLMNAPAAKVTPDLRAAAERAAAFAQDGAAIQTGVGAAPAAILPFLHDRRGLRIVSGMVTDEYRALADAGALGDKALNCAGIAYGADAFYDYLAKSDLLEFASAAVTHDVEALGKIPAFVSFGSALEVDLFGQINLEWRRTQAISGVGGAPDFARAARLSAGGAAIIALPATAEKGAVSRIVARLAAPTISMSRDIADVIVTEHGVARLGGLSVDARAEALIEIAAPAFRSDLTAQWRDLRRSL